MNAKDKGNIKKTETIVANGVQFLNGENCFRNAKVPFILLDYMAPENSHKFAKGERFALWFKLEEAEWRTMTNQLNKDLRELTIWLDEENKQRLKDFLNKE